MRTQAAKEHTIIQGRVVMMTDKMAYFVVSQVWLVGSVLAEGGTQVFMVGMFLLWLGMFVIEVWKG